jgi:hypothetical protein
MPTDFLIKSLNACRTLEKALADLEASYEHRPKEELAHMIAHAKAEIADRQRTRAATERAAGLTRRFMAIDLNQKERRGYY